MKLSGGSKLCTVVFALLYELATILWILAISMGLRPRSYYQGSMPEEMTTAHMGYKLDVLCIRSTTVKW